MFRTPLIMNRSLQPLYFLRVLPPGSISPPPPRHRTSSYSMTMSAANIPQLGTPRCITTTITSSRPHRLYSASRLVTCLCCSTAKYLRAHALRCLFLHVRLWSLRLSCPAGVLERRSRRPVNRDAKVPRGVASWSASAFKFCMTAIDRASWTGLGSSHLA